MAIPYSVVSVLEKMASTTRNAHSKHYTPGTYPKSSAAGLVAHYLYQHHTCQGYILFFGDLHKVAHVCLYSASGEKIVDAKQGKPVSHNGHVFYICHLPESMDEYPLLFSLTVDAFFSRYHG